MSRHAGTHLTERGLPQCTIHIDGMVSRSAYSCTLHAVTHVLWRLEGVGACGPGILAGAVGLVANLVLQVPPLGPGLGIDDWLRVSIYVAVSFLIALITDRLERTNSALAVSLAEQREQEAQTRAVVNGVVEALALVSPDNYRVLSVNHQFEEMFGVTAPQVIGQRLDELQSLVDRVFAEPGQFRERVASTARSRPARPPPAWHGRLHRTPPAQVFAGNCTDSRHRRHPR
jgi:PAS domain-containing protein